MSKNKHLDTMKRAGKVYSLYLKNLRNLATVALVLTAIAVWLCSGSTNYLRNYLFGRAEVDWAQLEGTGNEIDLSTYDTTGVRPASGNVSPDMFELKSPSGMYTRAYYQGEDTEHCDYRFRVTLQDVRETGVWYDNLTNAYDNCADLNAVQQRLDESNMGVKIGEEAYVVDRLLLVTIEGRTFLAAARATDEFAAGQTLSVVFSQMDACYLYDAAKGGNTQAVQGLYVDLRGTPVDYEDEDFKDAVLIVPLAAIVLLLTILFAVFPHWHPIYRQLARYGKTISDAVDRVDAEYEAGEGVSRQGKTIYMPTFMITRSFFMYVIRRNHNVVESTSTIERARSFQAGQAEASKNNRYRR